MLENVPTWLTRWLKSRHAAIHTNRETDSRNIKIMNRLFGSPVSLVDSTRFTTAHSHGASGARVVIMFKIMLSSFTYVIYILNNLSVQMCFNQAWVQVVVICL